MTSSPERRRATRIATIVAAALASVAATAAIASTIQRPPPDAPRARALATGALAMSNSNEARAIFRAANLAPGSSATGTVTITNTGTVPGSLALSPARAQTSGAGGAALLDALWLRIADVTAGLDAPVYHGRLDRLPALALSTLNAGAGRSFLFSAVLPEGGASANDAGDNRFQLASMTVVYDWTLTASATPPPLKVSSAQPSVRQAPCRQCATQPADRHGGRRSDLRQGGADRISGRGGIDCIWAERATTGSTAGPAPINCTAAPTATSSPATQAATASSPASDPISSTPATASPIGATAGPAAIERWWIAATGYGAASGSCGRRGPGRLACERAVQSRRLSCSSSTRRPRPRHRCVAALLRGARVRAARPVAVRRRVQHLPRRAGRRRHARADRQRGPRGALRPRLRLRPFRAAVEDLDELLARLAAAGIEPEKPPYAPGGRDEFRICFVADPDGYRIELIDGDFETPQDPDPEQ